MNFTDDELRIILDAHSSLDINEKLDDEDTATMHAIRAKIREHFDWTHAD